METPGVYDGTAQQALHHILHDRPVAYHPILAKALGSVTAALFLSQLLYWQGKGERDDGWIEKTRDEMTEETGLSRWDQERARKVLLNAGLMEEKLMGIPAKIHYRLDVAAITKWCQKG